MNPHLERCLFLVLLACAPLAAAQAPSVSLQVTATDPQVDATLQRGEPFYVRVTYRSDRALRVRIQGLSEGRNVPTMTNPSPRSDPPAGEALVWVAADDAAALDEVEVRAEDQQTGKVIARASLPVRLQWTGVVPAQPRQVADWAQAMSGAQQRAVSQEMRRYSEGDGFGGVLLGLIISLSLPGYLAVQIWALIRLRGGWRKATLVPLVVMAGALVVSLLALSHGSNLWPIWLILLAPCALLWLILILIAHRSLGRGRAQTP